MKIMLIVGEDDTAAVLEQNLHPRGFEFIVYRNPIKALDNIEEINPDIVLFSAEDYPRHWKPFLNVLRGHREKNQCVMILLVGEYFPFEEAAKAMYLKINGIIGNDFGNKRKMLHIEGLLNRYKMIRDNRRGMRYIPDIYDEIEFIFSHPKSMKFITGLVDDVSTEGVGFSPDSPHLTADLDENDIIPSCSLRINEDILTLDCRVIRNSKNLALAFEDLPEDEKIELQTYIDNRPARELEHMHDEEQVPAPLPVE